MWNSKSPQKYILIAQTDRIRIVRAFPEYQHWQSLACIWGINKTLTKDQLFPKRKSGSISQKTPLATRKLISWIVEMPPLSRIFWCRVTSPCALFVFAKSTGAGIMDCFKSSVKNQLCSDRKWAANIEKFWAKIWLMSSLMFQSLVLLLQSLFSHRQNLDSYWRSWVSHRRNWFSSGRKTPSKHLFPERERKH